MLVVLHVCAKDLEAAERNLRWCIELEGRCSHDCLITHEFGFQTGRVAELAVAYFRRFQSYEYPVLAKGHLPWPAFQNHAFRKSALRVRSNSTAQHWLWWEADAVPLRAGWLDTLDQGYRASGKPFMGALGANPDVPPYLNGVAIYPHDLTRFAAQAMFYGRQPFDIAGGWRVFHNATISPLFQHVWSWSGPRSDVAPSFTDASAMHELSPNAVLFHRCKDGSLIEQLRRNGPPKEAKRGVRMRRRGEKLVYLLLGRSGDIIQTLPAFWDIHRQEKVKPVVVVSSQYAPVLDGCSYVTPYVVECDWWKGAVAAKQEAAKKFKTDVTVVQCNGAGLALDKTRYPTYGATMAARLDRTMHQTRVLPLVFDRRDSKREHALANRWALTNPLVLFNFSGISSPFPHWPQVLDAIRKSCPGAQFVDLSQITAHRIYDLLGLYGAAEFLVTSDTATMHLAQASLVPYIGFTVDGWNSSVPRGRCALNVKYSQALAMLPIIAAVAKRRIQKAELHHIWQNFIPTNADTCRRQSVAMMSWNAQPWSEVPVAPEASRQWKEDGRSFVYIRDIIDTGCEGLPDSAAVCFTNTDICVRSDATERMLERLKETDACYCFRRDFSYDFDAPLPDATIHLGHDYCGSDMYAFRVGWWKRVRMDMPDMLLGLEAWDPCLRRLMDETNPGKPVLIRDLSYHRRHGSFWEQPENRYKLRGQRYCLEIAARWMRDHGVDPETHGIPKEFGQ